MTEDAQGTETIRADIEAALAREVGAHKRFDPHSAMLLPRLMKVIEPLFARLREAALVAPQAPALIPAALMEQLGRAVVPTETKRRPACEHGDCKDHYGDDEAWCGKCAPPRSPGALAEVQCLDCGMAYGGADWLDTSLSPDQWRLIHPDEGGILCANCIVRRAAHLPHVIRMITRIEFAADVPLRDRSPGALETDE